MTIVEVVIAVGIQAVVLLGVYAAVVTCTRLQKDNYQHNLVSAEAQRVADRLISDVRGALALENSFSDAGKTYQYSTSTLILRYPSIDANGIPLDVTAKFDRIIYHPGASNYIYRTVIPGAGSSRTSEERLIGRSTDPRIGVAGSYLAKPDALGAYVVHYEFCARRLNPRAGAKRPDYISTVAGSVYLRNKS